MLQTRRYTVCSRLACRNQSRQLTIKSLAACSVTLILLWLLRKQDGASQEPCNSRKAEAFARVPEDASKQQQRYDRGMPGCISAFMFPSPLDV